MKKKTIKVQVELEFESTNGQPIHIKKWWVENRVEDAIEQALPSMHAKIRNVDIELKSVKEIL